MNPIIQNLTFSSQGEQITLGDNTYNFHIQLLNADGQSVVIKFASVIELNITDTITSFAQEGYLIINNNLDAIESVQSISTDVRGRPQQAFQPFQFRGDGRDFLLVSIQPATNVNNDDPVQMSKNDEQSFNMLFTIYNSEDIIFEEKDIKLKKLYLCDYTVQVLNEKNAYFSTSKITQEKGNSNTQRSVKTGIAILRLLADVFSQDFNIKQTFSTEWDVGEESVFYSSPANSKAIDDLTNLLSVHVSSKDNDNCPSLLRKSRNNVWTLTPITTMFKQAYYKGNSSFGDIGGTRLVENFILNRPNTGQADPLNLTNRNPQASYFANNFPDYSFIENFESANNSATSSTYGYVTHAVHNYNIADKTFSVDLENNNISSVFKKYKKNFVQSQKGIIGSSPSRNIILNKTKTENKAAVKLFSPYTNQVIRLNAGQNQILLNAIFNNTAVSFTTRGSIFREAGKFFTIERKDAGSDSSFDNKIMGTYLFSKVEHIFKNGQYYNTIVGVKTYVTDKTDNSDDIT